VGRHGLGQIKKAFFWLLPFCVLAVLVRAYIFSVFDHNEHMYLAAAEGLAVGKTMYRDFAFLQMPLQPWAIWLVKTVSTSSSWLWAGKTLGWIAWFGLAITTFLLVEKERKSWLSASFVALCVALHPTVLRCAMESSNYILPAFLCLLSWWSARQGQSAIGAFGAGCFMALAAATKLFYVAFIPLVWLCIPNRQKGWGLLGIGIGLLPALYYGLQFPEDFIFQNWTFHQLTSAWRADLDSGTGFTLAEKWDFLRQWLTHWSTGLWMVAAVWSGVQARKNLSRWHFILMWLTFSVTLFAALFPAPLFEQYMLLPWLGGVFLLSQAKKFSFRLWCVLALAHLFTDPMGIMYRPFRTSYVQGTQEIALKIKEAGADSSWQVAGFSPIYGMDAGLKIADVWRTGIFLSRLDQRLSADARWVRLSEINTYLEQNQPEVILTGEEGAYDHGLEAYAKAHHYQLLEGTAHMKVWMTSK
jgi:hypothetical protein